MRVVPMTRRQLIAAAAAGGTSVSIGERCAWSAPDQRFDFTRPLDDWTTVSGKWAIEEVSGASQGGRALVQRATENELREFCRQTLAHFKTPRYWKFVDCFPTTVTGKIQKYKIREQAIVDLGLEDAAKIETA